MQRIALSILTGMLAAASAAGQAQPPAAPTAAATRPATPASRQARPVKYTLLVPTDADAAVKGHAAVVLSGKPLAESPCGKFVTTLTGKGLAVLVVHPEGTYGPDDGAWPESDAARLMDAVDRAFQNRGGTRKLLLVATAEAGPVALQMIDLYHRRLAGAVLISVAPLQRTPAGIDLWAPRGDACRVPVWAVVGTRPQDAASTLKMWRQVAAVQPPGAPLTVDARPGQGPADAAPDQAVADWLDAIVADKPLPAAPDRQGEQERRIYQPLAKALRTAAQDAPALPPGAAVKKAEAPMELAVIAPEGWQRDPRGERKYDPQDSPYVQVYLTPSPGGSFFARAAAAHWSGSADGLLDDYARRLRRRGFLVVEYDRWAAGDTELRIVSILWPTRDKWHRWLVLMAAGPGSKASPAAPLAIVLDATARPDVRAMAGAAKRLLASLQARWPG